MTLLIRCPKCKRENYAPAVASGVCCWCHYDVNKERNVEDITDPWDVTLNDGLEEWEWDEDK